MSDKSGIEWTDATWNPTTGCTVIPGERSGCTHCYAKKLVDTRLAHNPTSVRYGHPFEDVMLHPERLAQVIRWKRPRRIFVNSLSDLFHADVPDRFIAKVYATMMQAQQHTFQVLTKRPMRMARIIPRIMGEAIIDRDFGSPYSPEHTSGAYTFPPPHIHFGASICSNDDKDRVKWLLLTPNALPWLSVEPFLGPVDDVPLEGIGWIVAGGESGPGARPLDPAWVRDLRDRANALGIPFFFKQWGGERNKRGGDDAVLDGKRWTQFPTTLSS